MEKTIIEVQTKGDFATLPGGIALREHPGGGSFMVQDFYWQKGGERSYSCGAYDLTLVEALEEFHRRCKRAERFDAGGALLPETVATAEMPAADEAIKGRAISRMMNDMGWTRERAELEWDNDPAQRF